MAVAAKRKKWQLRYRTTSAVDNFPSERKAYAFIQDLARAYFANPDRNDPRVYVFVDEGDGRGWEAFENVMLSDLGHLAEGANLTAGE